jgi:GAF domain-containing protein
MAPVADDVYGDPATRATERPVGERLVGELFEALHGFHFLEDVREGAAFLGRVLEEKMRPATVLVHVYDINSGHFVVMSASGARSAALVDYATPEDEPFVVEIMNEDEATLVLQPGDDPRLSRGRWLLVEPRTSVLCAPVAIESRYLGLVELIDPLDGSEFDEDDRNALTYAASAFAKFLDRRGIVLSEDEPSAETSVSPQASAPGF